MVTPEFPPKCGGIGYYVFYLSSQLINIGFDIQVMVRGKEEKNYVYNGIKIKEMSIHNIPPFNNRDFSYKLEKEIDQDKFDIVHIHSTSMPKINSHLPLIVTSHWCIKENTKLFYRPINNMESFYRNIMYLPYCSAEKNLVKNCSQLTVVSESMRDDYLRLYGVSSIVIYNGVSVELFTVNPNIKREAIIIYFGVLKRGKGLLDLLDAIILLNKKDPKYKYFILGNGPLRRKLEAIKEKHNLKNFFLLGSVNHKELIKILSRSSVFVLPSYYEGLPNTILESMACETPVIASNVKGNNELVKNDFNGCLFERGNAVDLADKIEKLLKSPDLQIQLGKNGRQFVIDNFTWDKVAQKLQNIYQKYI